MTSRKLRFTFFFFNDTATTEIYTLSLHDALPISTGGSWAPLSSTGSAPTTSGRRACRSRKSAKDRKSTRLNSSHSQISYAVFCLKKKNKRVSQHAQDPHHHPARPAPVPDLYAVQA